MTDLLDTNVWLALADPDHVHHPAATQYWLQQTANKAAFCRVSMIVAHAPFPPHGVREAR